MKKMICMLLVTLILVSLAACELPVNDGSSLSGTTSSAPDQLSSEGGTDPTSSVGKPTIPSASSTAPTTPSVPSTSSAPSAPSAPSDSDDKPAANPQASVVYEDVFLEFIWTEIDDSNGILQIAEVAHFPGELLESVGLTGTLTYKPEIVSYAVTYTKTADGVYVAEGAIQSVAASVEGESAEAFIQMMKQNLDDSKLDEMTGRVLDGEVLTAKEDIEWLIWKYDTCAKVTFTVVDGVLTVSEYEQNYISWGFQAPTREVFHVENGVVRAYDEYEDDELVRIMEYRENGVIEKEIYYWEGEVSSTTYYDENGEEIVEG